MKADYDDDPTISDHLEYSRSSLFDYFNRNYAKADDHTLSSASSSPVTSLPIVGSPQKSFTAQYCRKDKSSINELEEYFKLPAEDFDTCNPIHWWMGQRSNSQTSFVWLMTFYAFLVSNFNFNNNHLIHEPNLR